MRAFVQPAMMRLMDDVQVGTFDFALTSRRTPSCSSASRRSTSGDVDIVIGAIVVSIALAQLSGTIRAGERWRCGLLVAGRDHYCAWLSIAAAAFWFVRIDFVGALRRLPCASIRSASTRRGCG